MVRSKIAVALVALILALVGPSANASDSNVAFNCVAPEAHAVFLAGEFNHWSTTATPMQRDGASGKWTATVPLSTGRHAYKFVVDGNWKTDDVNPDLSPDGFGGMNSMMTVSDPNIDPVVQEKEAVRLSATRLFAKSDFAQLEKNAEDLRRNKARFSDGLWQLRKFYDGLEAKREVSEQKNWQPWFAKLERWKQEFPASITQPVVLARGWLDYAARASGDERRERLTKARIILEAATNSPERCPEWFAAMQNVAADEDWSVEDYAKLLAEAAAAEPTYYDFYSNASWFSFHKTGEWISVPEDAATKFDPSEGMAAYARTVWFMENFFTNRLRPGISWDKLRAGFLDIEKRYPNSRWNLNAFCRYAVRAKDRQTASILFNRIGEHGDPNWEGYGRYEMARLWADPSTPSWRIESRLTIVAPTKTEIQAIAFSPDGQFIASGDDDGRIILWEANSGSEIWREQVSNFPVMSVVFSSDGRLLAAGAGAESYAAPGVAKVWDVATKNEVAAAHPHGAVWRIAFTPDGSALALSGGDYEKQAESSLLDLSTQELRALPWTKGHDHMLKSMAISPDGTTLVADCYQSLTVWSLTENRVLFDTRNLLKDFVLRSAFSPDGKTLVTSGAPMRGHNDTEPGELTLWDAATWTPRNPRTQTDAGGLIAVGYSPNGEWIVGGGYDRAVHVWNGKTLESKIIYPGLSAMIDAVAFSPDGKTIASAGDDGAIRLWSFPY